MVLCGGIVIVLLFMSAVLQKKSFWQNIRSPCRIVVLFSILGFLSEMTSTLGGGQDMSGQIARNVPGGGELETEAFVYLPGEEAQYPVILTIPEQKYTKKKEMELITASKKEIEDTFCGQNNSFQEIVTNPVIFDSYQNGAVSAEWIFSDNEIISEEGEIYQQALKRSKEKMEAFVLLSCGESEESYRFSFQIIPLKKSRQEELALKIQEHIALQEETKNFVTLPNRIDGQKIEWKETKSFHSIELLGLGLLAALAAAYAEKEKKEKKLQNRKRKLLLSYPEFVSKLSLLLGAGMTISGAMRKMNQMYLKRKKAGGREEIVYEELYQMICELDNGMGELRAYQRFSESCNLQPYRKLVSLLVLGQKVGNFKLMEQLNEEADRVFVERKNTARRLGEEAGTKMLVPMMIMLAIVMGIVIIPAFLSIYK